MLHPSDEVDRCPADRAPHWPPKSHSRRPAPAEIYATLLDEGFDLCSVRTFYRVLADHGDGRERRDRLRHPVYQKPDFLARQPNEVWSWDITKLRGPAKWTFFYVIIDIFMRTSGTMRPSGSKSGHAARYRTRTYHSLRTRTRRAVA